VVKGFLSSMVFVEAPPNNIDLKLED